MTAEGRLNLGGMTPFAVPAGGAYSAPADLVAGFGERITEGEMEMEWRGNSGVVRNL